MLNRKKPSSPAMPVQYVLGFQTEDVRCSGRLAYKTLQMFVTRTPLRPPLVGDVVTLDEQTASDHDDQWVVEHVETDYYSVGLGVDGMTYQSTTATVRPETAADLLLKAVQRDTPSADVHDAAVNGAVNALDDAVSIIEILILFDDTACSLDHHGYCQAHGWFHADVDCPYKMAADFLALMQDEGDTDA